MTEKMRNLRRRAMLLAVIREYFTKRDFLEVETPVRIDAPAPEEFIETVTADGKFLRPSPELAMKGLLSEGFERIFEIGSCFRSGELGWKHREEFTMLEFYARGMEYHELARFTAAMIRECGMGLNGEPSLTWQARRVNLEEVEFLTVRESFSRYAGVAMEESEARGDFDELMVTRIEPELGRGRITILTDYPAGRASLARLRRDDPTVAERWELYIEGMELANAFGELTNAAEQKQRFREAAVFRATMGMHKYPEPTEFFEALERGLPESSGCALGLDRLTMLFCDADDITKIKII